MNPYHEKMNGFDCQANDIYLQCFAYYSLWKMKTSTKISHKSPVKILPKVSKKPMVSRIVPLSEYELFSSIEKSRVVSRGDTILNIVIHRKSSASVQEINYRDIIENGLYIPPADHKYSVAQLAMFWNSPKRH
jgi:hypothetical protein